MGIVWLELAGPYEFLASLIRPTFTAEGDQVLATTTKFIGCQVICGIPRVAGMLTVVSSFLPPTTACHSLGPLSCLSLLLQFLPTWHTPRI